MSATPLFRASPRPRYRGRCGQFGFTLIELLTVIAVIGVLAAILFPVLAKVKEAAHSSKCASNLHQVGIAIQTYANDNKGSLPPTGFFGVSSYYNRDQRNFQNSLLPYLSLPQATTWSNSTDLTTHSDIFDCPGYKGNVGGKGYVLQQTVTAPDGTTMKPWGAVSMTGTITTKTSKISILPDGAWAIRDNEPGTTEPNTGELNHRGYRNTLYFDWHVARVAMNN
ncbi:MAG: type II secretion system protein [Opitutaceae bacterium]|jgi:prepilin-type N-terminal cleavage/methylation domain-containing protein/prepilin-type processing-associated H-X9-DG protein